MLDAMTPKSPMTPNTKARMKAAETPDTMRQRIQTEAFKIEQDRLEKIRSGMDKDEHGHAEVDSSKRTLSGSVSEMTSVGIIAHFLPLRIS